MAEAVRLGIAAQEALDGASMIGTPASQLAETRAALARAQLRIQQEENSMAGHTKENLQQLRAAVNALQQAEETAVDAGLKHIERELAAGYAQVLTPRFGEKRRLSATVRVVQGVAYLRRGAGIDFDVVGKARAGDMLNVMTERGNWYRVRTQEGMEGWIAKDLVSYTANQES